MVVKLNQIGKVDLGLALPLPGAPLVPFVGNGPFRGSLNFSMANGKTELPLDVILSLERILNIRNATQAESLDTLSSNFNHVPMLNELFPDGQC